MTQLWMDGFDHYGTTSAGVTAMLEGPWAEVDAATADGPVIPSFGARTGTHALQFTATSAHFGRRVITANETTVIIGMGLYLPSLPDLDERVTVCAFLSAGTVSSGVLYVNSDGSLQLNGVQTTYNSWRSATTLASTTGPAVVAGTWHHIEVSFTQDAAAGAIEVRVDEAVVMTETGLDTGSSVLNQIFFGYVPQSTAINATVPAQMYYDDIVLRNLDGSVNNGFEGDLKVATLQPISNGTTQGWSTRSIEKLGVGVLKLENTIDRDLSVTFADNAALELGASTYTLEQFVRFDSIPTLSQEHVVSSKWLTTASDNRSWRLYVDGPDLNGSLIFEVSTDGTSGTATKVHQFPFIPEKNRWYHVEIDRNGTDSFLFLDGVQLGITKTDSNTYFDGIAALAISGQMVSSSAPEDFKSIEGWVDGFRLTVGVARHTANFTPPTAALPTSVAAGDASYASVQLLMNFDNDAITDQSTNAFTGTLRNGAAQELPDDSDAFQTIDALTPNDFNFVEAALIAATGTLTLTANPLDTETVTLGSFTYTFETVLTAAGVNTVLIGAAATDSLDNLRAAVNLEAGSGTLYGSGTLINTDAGLTDLPDDQILATADTAGAAGNSLTTTETLTNGSWSAATLLGGADIPGESEFTLSSLPSEVTGVRAVAIVNRAFKTDSGPSTLQTSFVESGGTSSQGTARSITTSPTYYEDTFETAPSGGSLTPSTLAGSLIRLNRTA